MINILAISQKLFNEEPHKEINDVDNMNYDTATKDVQENLMSFEELQNQFKLQQEFITKQKELLTQDPLYQNNVNIGPSSTSSSSYNPKSFTQGLIIGQLSVIVVIAIFIKFFVFADPSSISPPLKDASGTVIKRKAHQKKEGNSNDGEGLEKSKYHARNVSTILEKTYYDVDNHTPESLDWFNVLIAQTISQIRLEALLSDNIYHSLNDFLMKLTFPDYLDKIRITEIDIGDDFPILSNCRIKYDGQESGRLQAKIDVDLSDVITLGIETRLLINTPKPVTAALPVQLSVSLVRFSGCLTVSLINTNDQEFIKSTKQEQPNDDNNSNNNNNNNNTEGQPSNGTAIMFSFSPDYRLEFSIRSLIGSRAKLEDVPKISALIEDRLKYWFVERCVEPRFQVIRLPSFWPTRKNVREQHSTNENNDLN